MTLTTHAIIGITLIHWTHNPLLAFCIGVISHYILDAIPHGDEWVYWRHVHNHKDRTALTLAAIDVVCLIGVVGLTLVTSDDHIAAAIIAASVGAILPDILITLHTKSHHQFDSPHQTTNQQRYYHFLKVHYRFHMFCHNIIHVPIRYRSAIGYQVIIVGLVVYWMILK